MTTTPHETDRRGYVINVLHQQDGNKMATQTKWQPKPSPLIPGGYFGARSCGFRENSQVCCGFRENLQVVSFGRPWWIFLKLTVFLITLKLISLTWNFLSQKMAKDHALKMQTPNNIHLFTAICNIEYATYTVDRRL
jgi:hypothetical protein